MTSAPLNNNSELNKRRRVLLIITGIFILLGAGIGLYWLLLSRYHEETDNAYVQGNIVQLTPVIAGTVIGIHADDTDSVKLGQALIELDPVDAQTTLAKAEAELAQTVRQVRTLYAAEAEAAAHLAQRQAELSRAEGDLSHRKNLNGTGAISNEELRHAEDNVVSAVTVVNAAREQWVASRALTKGISVRHHPNVALAAAKVLEAMLTLQRTTLSAPVSGQVAKRNVQMGQRVSPGAALLTIVPLDQLWVDANFKEAQLRNVHIGQSALLTSDLYGSEVKFKGTVIGLGAGTGSAFALLPAQNATGNWIKVVQRVPVRIALDPLQLTEHPLRIGLSMHADIDVREQNTALPASSSEVSRNPIQTVRIDKAQARIDSIINANLK